MDRHRRHPWWSAVSRYRRKPTEIEAVRWDGTDPARDAIEAMGAAFGWLGEGRLGKLIAGKGQAQGEVDVPIGHWVAKAAADDFYPIDPGVFAVLYEAVE